MLFALRHINSLRLGVHCGIVMKLNITIIVMSHFTYSLNRFRQCHKFCPLHIPRTTVRISNSSAPLPTRSKHLVINGSNSECFAVPLFTNHTVANVAICGDNCQTCRIALTRENTGL